MEDHFLAYFKYSGNKTKEGTLDARKAAEVFLGIDKRKAKLAAITVMVIS